MHLQLLSGHARHKASHNHATPNLTWRQQCPYNDLPRCICCLSCQHHCLTGSASQLGSTQINVLTPHLAAAASERLSALQHLPPLIPWQLLNRHTEHKASHNHATSNLTWWQQCPYNDVSCCICCLSRQHHRLTGLACQLGGLQVRRHTHQAAGQLLRADELSQACGGQAGRQGRCIICMIHKVTVSSLM